MTSEIKPGSQYAACAARAAGPPGREAAPLACAHLLQHNDVATHPLQGLRSARGSGSGELSLGSPRCEPSRAKGATP